MRDVFFLQLDFQRIDFFECFIELCLFHVSVGQGIHFHVKCLELVFQRQDVFLKFHGQFLDFCDLF